MKRPKTPDRNLELVEADKDLVRLIRRHARKNHLKIYGLTSELLTIGLRMKRLLPAPVQDGDTQPHSQV